MTGKQRTTWKLWPDFSPDKTQWSKPITEGWRWVDISDAVNVAMVAASPDPNTGPRT